MFGRFKKPSEKFDFPGILTSMRLAHGLSGSIPARSEAEKAQLVLLTSIVIEQMRTNELLQHLVNEAKRAALPLGRRAA